jgi:emfourin
MAAGRVEFTRSGGVTGVSLTTSLDTDELAPAERDALEALLAHRPEGNPALPGRGADRFQYDLTVTGDGPPRRITLREGELPPAARPLIDRLVAHARHRP